MQLRKVLKNGGTSRAMKRQRSSFIWPCEASLNSEKSTSDLEGGYDPIRHQIRGEILTNEG
jgi:hypothetical protein